MRPLRELSFNDAGTLTLPDLLERRVEETPDAIAIQTPLGSLTYSSWLTGAKGISALLREDAGVSPGDCVLIWIDSADARWFVAATHAVFDAGAIVAPLDDRLSAPDFRRLQASTGASAAIVSSTILAALTLEAQEELGFLPDSERQESHGLLIVPAEGLRLIAQRATRLNELPSDLSLIGVPTAKRTPEDCAFLAFTSGSTGLPKGAMVSHGGSVQLAERMTNAIFALPRGGRRVGPEDVIQSPIPAYLGTSIANNLYPAVFAGCPLVYRGRRFDPRQSEEDMVINDTTIYNGAPAHYAMMCQLPRTDVTDRVAVDVMITAGSPLTQEHYRQFRQRWPRTAISNWYALNETMVGQTLNYGAGMERDPCAVGEPVWPTEVRIIDSGGYDKPLGEEGEVLLRSPGQMMGYFRDEVETAKRIQRGWIHTGDCGNLSQKDGQLRLTGRVVERINRGGFKFYPAEVEEVLLEHPSVIDSAVIGVPHELLGQDAVAFVVLRDRINSGEDTSEILKEHCRGNLARNKVPGAIVVLDKLPRSGYGKLLKNELFLQWVVLSGAAVYDDGVAVVDDGLR